MHIDTTAPTLVTGATGYVAGWVVKRLLDAGVTVHAAVRDPDDVDKVGHLVTMAQNAPGTLRLFAADLLEDGAYTDAMQGCRVVFHTASPFRTRVRDPRRELVEPAVNGTRNVLETANATGSVERVVVTSSCAAIYTDAADCADAPGGRLTEDIWNTTASLDYQPYSHSKTLAEREAWKIAGEQDRWRLVVVNPSLVIGPATHSRPTSESFGIVRQLGDGTMKAGAPRFGLGVVDVRDLAQAHLAAAYLPDAAGRHIISGYGTDFLELAATLRERYGDDFPLPRRALPKWLVWLLAPWTSGIPRRVIARNVNHPWRADNTKSREKLGIEYRPMAESMNDMFAQMIESGQFTRE